MSRASVETAPVAERKLASRVDAVSPFLAMDVLSAARSIERAGGDVIHMELGEPCSPTPRLVREAAKSVLEIGRIGYTEALGYLPLRERIARHYAEAYGVDVDTGRIVITTGSSAGFILSFLALFEPGSRVAISSPGYPAYRNIFAALGIEVVPLPLNDANHWAVTAEAIRLLHAQAPLAGVLTMSPANPTGTVMQQAELASLAHCCKELGLWFISDEIYHGLTYEGRAETALRFDDDIVAVNSFSKYYCMTGWRVGWLVLPERAVRAVERLAQNLFIAPPYLSQVAAVAAFDATEELEEIKAGYAVNRAMLLNELPSLGLGKGPRPDGAFYSYIDVGHLTNDSVAFCRAMLNEAGVAATPGPDFDPDNGNRFIRLSYAGSQADCREAIRRLKQWLPG